MIQLDRYLNFLERHKLTQPQFLLLYCLYLKRYDLITKYKKMFPADDGSMIGSILLDDLIDRGFLVNATGGATAKDFGITKKFTVLFIDRYQAAEEFRELYPPFMISDGKRFPLTAMDEDEFREMYMRKIVGSAEEHLEVMKDLKFATDNNLIQMSMKNFVGSKQWLAIRKERIKVGEERNDPSRARL